MKDDTPKIVLISSATTKGDRDITSADLMEEVRDTIGSSDAFILIPVAFVEYENQTGLEAEVKMYDRMTEGDPDFLEGVYFAALGALYTNACDKFNPQNVVRYLIGLTPEINPNAKKH